MTIPRGDAAERAAAEVQARAALAALEQIAQGGPVPAADPELSRLVAAMDARLWATADAGVNHG